MISYTIWDEDENGSVRPREMTPEEIVLFEAEAAIGNAVGPFSSLEEIQKHLEEEKCTCGHLKADHGRATVDTEKSCFRCGCRGFETQEPES